MKSCLEPAQYFWLKCFLDTGLLAYIPLTIPLSNAAINKAFLRYPNNSICGPLMFDRGLLFNYTLPVYFDFILSDGT